MSSLFFWLQKIGLWQIVDDIQSGWAILFGMLYNDKYPSMGGILAFHVHSFIKHYDSVLRPL